MKGLLIKGSNGWSVKYIESDAFCAPIIDVLSVSNYTREASLSQDESQYLEELRINGDPHYNRIIDHPYVEFEILPEDGSASLIFIKRDAAWKTIEKEIRSAFIYGQGNARMMDAGLERDEVDDHVNWVMSKLVKKYNPPTLKG
jgi:hypothetical protein